MQDVVSVIACVYHSAYVMVGPRAYSESQVFDDSLDDEVDGSDIVKVE